MLCRQEIVAVCILALVTCLCFAGTIFLDGIGKEQFSKDYVPGLTDGTLVSYSGIAGPVTYAKGGSVMLEVSGVRVFVPASAGLIPDIQEGRSIDITGVVQHWKGTEEIMVEDTSDIRVIS